MDKGRHTSRPIGHWKGLLPQKGQHPYPRLVATDSSDVRRFRADDELWDAYTKVVGERRRSADIRRYLEWRVKNPDDPLPGEWRGPVRKVHTERDES